MMTTENYRDSTLYRALAKKLLRLEEDATLTRLRMREIRRATAKRNKALRREMYTAKRRAAGLPTMDDLRLKAFDRRCEALRLRESDPPWLLREIGALLGVSAERVRGMIARARLERGRGP